MTIILSPAQRDQLVRFADLAEGRLLNPGHVGWEEGAIVGTTTCVYHSYTDSYEVCFTKQPSFSRFKPDSDAVIKRYCVSNDYGSNKEEPHVLYYLNSELDGIIRKHRLFLEKTRGCGNAY